MRGTQSPAVKKAMLTFASAMEARKRAEGQDFIGYEIDWKRAWAGSKRAIYAWDADGRFIGEFITHLRAVNAGAAVTRVGVNGAWFMWTEKVA